MPTTDAAAPAPFNATAAVVPFRSYGLPAGITATGPGGAALAAMNAQDALQAQQVKGLGGGGVKRRRQRKARGHRGALRGGSDGVAASSGAVSTGTNSLQRVTVPSFEPIGPPLTPQSSTSASVAANSALLINAGNVPGDDCATGSCAPVPASNFPAMKGGRKARSTRRVSTRRSRRSSRARGTRRVATSGKRASSRRVRSLRRYLGVRRRTLVALRSARRNTIRDTNRALRSAERLGLTKTRDYAAALRARDARWEATTRTGRSILTRARR
jgi:hypothetical protein